MRLTVLPRRAVPAFVLALSAALVAPGQLAAQSAEYPFRNPGLPVAKRVDDLLGRLTLDERLSLLHQSQAAIPRLGIPYFKAGTEALHGVAWSNDLDNNWSQVLADRATVFPQAVGLASTWDPALIKRVGSASWRRGARVQRRSTRRSGACRSGRRWSTCCATPDGGATRRATPRTPT